MNTRKVVKTLTLLAAFVVHSGSDGSADNQASSIVAHRIPELDQVDDSATLYKFTSAYTCICATLLVSNVKPETSTYSMMSENTFSLVAVIGHSKGIHLNILKCPINRTICRKWSIQKSHGSPYETRIYNNQSLKSFKVNSTNKHHTKPLSCVIIVNNFCRSGHSDLINEADAKNKKISDFAPTNFSLPTTRRQNVFVLHYQRFYVHLSSPTIAPKTTRLSKSPTKWPVLLHGENSLSEKRKRRSASSMAPFKPIFPYLRSELVERKRSVGANRNPELRNLNLDTGKQTQRTAPHAKSLMKHDRRKRQTHVMIVRYRKDNENTENRRHKRADDDDCEDDSYQVSTSPYTFLNVSFTGYWEFPKGRTTVKPRVQKPLKMTDLDLDFVYGNSGYENNKSKGRSNKGKAGGWPASLTVNIHT